MAGADELAHFFDFAVRSCQNESAVLMQPSLLRHRRTPSAPESFVYGLVFPLPVGERIGKLSQEVDNYAVASFVTFQPGAVCPPPLSLQRVKQADQFPFKRGKP